MTYIGVILTFVFVNNFVLVEFLGLCPALKATEGTGQALMVGFWLSMLMSLSAGVAWLLHALILAPLGLGVLQTFVYVLVVAGLARGSERVIRQLTPGLHSTLGAYGTYVGSNCAVLGIALIVGKSDYNLAESVLAGLAAGGGTVLAMILLATLREKLDRESVPRPFRGTPIMFISTGLVALAFLAFDYALLGRILG